MYMYMYISIPIYILAHCLHISAPSTAEMSTPIWVLQRPSMLWCVSTPQHERAQSAYESRSTDFYGGLHSENSATFEVAFRDGAGSVESTCKAVPLHKLALSGAVGVFCASTGYLLRRHSGMNAPDPAAVTSDEMGGLGCGLRLFLFFLWG